MDTASHTGVCDDEEPVRWEKRLEEFHEVTVQGAKMDGEEVSATHHTTPHPTAPYSVSPQLPP